MSFKSYINKIRRDVMYSITKHVGSNYVEPAFGSLKKESINSILIVRPNHRLGNQVLLTALVEEVTYIFPNAKISLFVKGGVAIPVFENYKQVIKVYTLPGRPFKQLLKYISVWFSIRSKAYDIVINGDKSSSSGRLLTQLAKGRLKIFGEFDEELEQEQPDYKHIAKYPVYQLRKILNTIGITTENREVPLLNINLSAAEIATGKKILEQLVGHSKPIICIYTNATGNKCYSFEWWENFYSTLLKSFPNYSIIEMLPIENISRINFKAPHFYSNNIREMGGVLHNTQLFIAADNGVMHLASASLVPTIGFFLVSDISKYKPYGNGSVAIDTNTTQMEDWIKTIHQILD